MLVAPVMGFCPNLATRVYTWGCPQLQPSRPSMVLLSLIQRVETRWQWHLYSTRIKSTAEVADRVTTTGPVGRELYLAHHFPIVGPQHGKKQLAGRWVTAAGVFWF